MALFADWQTYKKEAENTMHFKSLKYISANK